MSNSQLESDARTASAAQLERYVADKADWLGARLPGTERPLATISKHSGGASP